MTDNIWDEKVYKLNKQNNKYPYTSIVSNVHNYCNNFVNKKCLDIGCGCGNNLFFLNNVGFNTYGIDISPTAIKKCENNLNDINKKSELYVGSSENLPYENNFFDLIIDRASITHNAHNFHECIDEVYRT